MLPRRPAPRRSHGLPAIREAPLALALKEHFKQIAADLTIPLAVQDHPTSSGVKMPVEFIASLYEFLPPGSVCKLEDPPTAVKMNKLRDAEPGYQIFGGLGGVSLLHELDAGSAGAMTGFAVVEGWWRSSVCIGMATGAEHERPTSGRCHCWSSKRNREPGLHYARKFSGGGGAIAHATVRQPAPTPDAFALNLLDDLLRSRATDSGCLSNREQRGGFPMNDSPKR
ncbi:MAG: hypothetical protein M9947_00550 [Thermomicrobiales bacterium]|nr:hypothetical protein [Thermomicrobiales bacterium]